MSSRSTRAHLFDQGFEGFKRFADLPNVPVSTLGGVYRVLRESDDAPVFSPASLPGRFKGREPSVALEKLAAAWVPDEQLIYIGRAAVGPSGRHGIAKRLDEYRRHGAGQPVGHWGGRCISQLADHDDLLVAWRPDDDPSAKTDLLDEFVTDHGRLRFANLRRGDCRRRTTP